MSEEKKKKNKIIGISIGILVVLLVVISSTYAYWQITKSQDGSNDIIAACLDIDMESVDGTFGLNPAWPISDTEGMNLKGYTFKVTNNCEEDVNYIIGMDSLEVNGLEYLSYDSIKVSIDDSAPMIYGKEETIEHIEENDQYTIRTSKKIATSTVKNGQPNEHNVKVWIKSDAPLEEQSKVFSGRVFITGGQNIKNNKPLVQATPEECFVMNGEEIIGYDESCGTSVRIPAIVKGNKVKIIDTNAFRDKVLGEIYYDSHIYGTSAETIESVSMVDFSSANVMYIFDNYTENTAINLSLENIIANSKYIVKLTPDAPLNATIDGAAIQYNVTSKVKNYDEIPEPEANQVIVYANLDEQLKGDTLGAKYFKQYDLISIKELDLSLATNLEKIEARAFSNYDAGINDMPTFIEQQNTKPISLTKLKFSKLDHALEIGSGSFNGIDVDELTTYSNMYGAAILEENYTIGHFAGAKINKLNVEYVDGFESAGDGTLFSFIKANQVNVGEGITEIAESGFATKDNSQCFIQNINLPKTINTINNRSLIHVKNINFEAGHCNDVKINALAWLSDTIVTPSTCVTGQNME